MLVIEYTNTGKAYSDFNLIQEAESIINNYFNNISSQADCNIKVSTSNIVEALRLQVVREKIKYEEIVVKYADTVLKLKNTGEFEFYPNGFMDWHKIILREMLEKRLNRRSELI